VDPQPTSTILSSLAASPQPSVPVSDIMAAMRTRAHGIGLILFAVPDAIPLPIPSLSAVLGVPLVLIAAHLVIFGEGSRLPRRVRAAKIPISVIRPMASWGVPLLRRLEFLARPRWHGLLRYERWIGLVCLYLATVLLLPIPFFNFLPALCLVAIALGMVQRDGMLVAVGLVATALLTFSLSLVMEWLGTFFSQHF
jgi:hypothetical protein